MTALRLSDLELSRFMAKIEPEPNSGCWIWIGSVNPDGYGRLTLRYRSEKAHRVAYEHFVGPIPAGFQVDHLCRLRRCVNPSVAHVEPVTQQVNLARGLGGPRTHCRHGHPIGGLVTRRDGTRSRYCRVCARRRLAARRLRSRPTQ